MKLNYKKKFEDEKIQLEKKFGDQMKGNFAKEMIKIESERSEIQQKIQQKQKEASSFDE